VSDCGSCNSYLEEVLDLQAQVAELKQELQTKGAQVESAALQNDLKIMVQQQARIKELEDALAWASDAIPAEITDPYDRGGDCTCPICKATSKSNLDALEAYRDGVIEEVESALRLRPAGEFMEQTFRVLKKGTT